MEFSLPLKKKKMSLREHLIKLERYREDYHGPNAKMTRTNQEEKQIYTEYLEK